MFTRPYAHGVNVFLPRKSSQTPIYDGRRRAGDSLEPVLCLLWVHQHMYACGQAKMENLVAGDVAAYFGVIKSEITVTATAMDSSDPGTIITLNMVRIYAMISVFIPLY